MFQSRIYVDGRDQNIGTYRTKKEAAMAWDLAAIRTKRPKCDLNFPDINFPKTTKKKKIPIKKKIIIKKKKIITKKKKIKKKSSTMKSDNSSSSSTSNDGEHVSREFRRIRTGNL